jgi:hypothetical protein
MADAEKTDKPETETGKEKAEEVLHRPHKGVKDAGHTVVGAADEPFSGTIADITDGDR